MKRCKHVKIIQINGLFNRFDYVISLSGDGLTILTGPNGYGKSTILKIINYLSIGEIGIFKLMEVSFKSLKISFKNGHEIFIENNSKTFSIDSVKIDKSKVRNLLRKLFTSRYGYYIDEEFIVDRRRGIKYTMSEYFEKILSNNDVESSLFYEESYFLKEFFNKESLSAVDKIKKSIGKVYMVQEQRLIKQINDREKNISINVIEEIPGKIKQKINAASSNYSAVASKLDGSYPNRLFSNMEELSEEDFKTKLEIMNFKWKKLASYNLSTIEPLQNNIYNREYAKALKIYFDDFDKKYLEYESLINEFDMFTEIVNRRLTHKKIRIEREKGIIVVDDNDELLNMGELSSGEKQIIVLFYELLFETEKCSLLLIDEPEISLHIVWQKMFMDDLLKITKLKNLNVIVATHSAQIINNHWDRQVDLEELYGKFN